MIGGVYFLPNYLRFWVEGIKALNENLCHVGCRGQLCEPL